MKITKKFRADLREVLAKTGTWDARTMTITRNGEVTARKRDSVIRIEYFLFNVSDAMTPDGTLAEWLRSPE
jgi:hypothetical protein